MSQSGTQRSIIDLQVKYAGMLWMLAAQVAVMLPFMAYLPVWPMLVLLICTGWRLRVLRGHWTQPSWWFKGAIIVLGLLALTISGLAPMSLDTASSLLLLAFAFKSLEVAHRRDAIVVIFTGYFVVAIQFLYSESIGAALYGVLCLILLTAALLAVQETPGKKISDHLRLAGAMLVQCLPLMVVVYLFFPRLPPLWAVNLHSDQAVSGITDEMTPGDIARLSQSDAVAFRVTFSGIRPEQERLYWRGLVLNYFDGQTWSQYPQSYSVEELKRVLRVDPVPRTQDTSVLAYDVVYEPTHQPWLFTLTRVTGWRGEALLGSDERLMATRALHSPTAFTLYSDLQAVRDSRLSPEIRRLTLGIPQEQNSRARHLARKWRGQSETELQYVQQVMENFRDQAFYYTLRPPLTGREDSIDRFLFETRRGFCSHYAGSFVYMMRAAGLPARVVVGYQGGEWNTGGQFLTVHEYDAHAWAEVWLEGQGWTRFDPTAMVAPERIEQNLRTAVKSEGSFLEARVFSLARLEWMTQLRQKWDAIEYGWRRWVLGYDHGMQTRWLQKWLGEITMQRVGLMFASLFGLIILFWLLVLGYMRRADKLPPALKLYHRLCQKLEKRGLKRPPDATPGQFGQMVAERFPGQAQPVQEAILIFERLSYAQPSADQEDILLVRLKALVKAV